MCRAADHVVLVSVWGCRICRAVGYMGLWGHRAPIGPHRTDSPAASASLFPIPFHCTAAP